MTARLSVQTISILLLTSSLVVADDAAPRTTIALTMTLPPDATKEDAERAKAIAAQAKTVLERAKANPAISEAHMEQAETAAKHADAEAERAIASMEQAEALLVLLEAEAMLRPGIAVVERRQIDLALHELMLSRSLSNDAAKTLQLGKIATADLIVSVRLQKAADDHKRRAFIRVTEPLTAVIRGATVVRIDGVDVEEAAEQMIHYVNAVVRSPKTAGLTVSVAPFESEGKFGHVRPLELIIRDVMTEQLRHDGGFQVLQRTDMRGLLDELDLVLSGLANPQNLPDTLPSREGVYHIHGTVNERIDDDNNMHMVVNAKLTQTSTGKVVLSLKKEFRNEDAARSLHQLTSQFVEVLRHGRSVSPAADAGAFDEAKELLDLAVRDAVRLIRRGPHSGGYHGIPVRSRLPSRLQVSVNTELARHLFRKTIDRLETVLFLQPENRSAQFALAYCYSFHLADIWNPERCDHLYRQVIHADKRSPLAHDAFRRLMGMYVHHVGSRRIQDEHIPRLIEQIHFVLTTAPPDAKLFFGRELKWLTQLHLKNENWAGLLKTTTLCWKRIEHKDVFAHFLDHDAREVAAALRILLTDPRCPRDVKRQAQQLLEQWSRHTEPKFRKYAFDHLDSLLMTEEQIEANHLAFARLVQQMPDPHLVDPAELRVTADYFIESERSALAVALLTRIDPSKVWPENGRTTPYAASEYYRTLAKAYEALNQREKARDAYIAEAETKHGAVIHAQTTRIMRLGGVPLREDRAIDVQNHRLPREEERDQIVTVNGKQEIRKVTTMRDKHCQVLATDGEQIFCGKLSRKLPGIWVLDLRTKTWRAFDRVPHYVTCMEVSNGILWAGTADHGLWKVNLASGKTTQWNAANGLPAETVVSMAVSGDDVYAAVSESSVISGGVVHINRQGVIRFLGGGTEPPNAPSSMLVADGKLLVVSRSEAYRWNEDKDRWSRFNGGERTTKMFYENGRLWAAVSAEGLHLKEVGPNGRTYTKDAGELNHRPYPYFLFDRGDYLWMGGRAWDYFRSSGLYRVHKETGQVEQFGPRDGFSIEHNANYTCYDAVIAKDRMWLAMHYGIAEVTVWPTAHQPNEGGSSVSSSR